jgi:N-acetylglucosamine malate deacetylase 1
MNLIFNTIKKVLVLGPHPDDMEFGCLGTILKLREKNIEIHLAVFSMCEKSVPAGMPKDVIKNEMTEVWKSLDFPEKNLHIFNYDVRVFPQFRQEILEDLVRLRNEIAPDMVFLPSSTDIHQDHETLHNEGKRAFKFNMLLGYEMPWNNFNFHADLFVTLSGEQVNKKIEMINKYKSQKHRAYSSNDFLKSVLRIRGNQINAEYAEAFEVLRLIV